MIYLQHGADKRNAEERVLNIISALRQKRLKSLYIEPASLCNLRCQFCDFQSNPNNENFLKKKGIMSMDVFYEVLEELKKLSFRFDQVSFHLHGEPLLCKDLSKMISLIRTHNIGDQLHMNTNGVLLYPDVMKKLIESGLNRLTLSLDTLSREKYRLFKGKDLLPQLLENIQHAIDIVEASDTDLDFEIKCVKAQGNYSITDEDSDNIINHFRRHAEKSSRVHVLIAKEITWYTKSKQETIPPDHSPCELPFYQVAINYDGSVSPCATDITKSLDLGCIVGRSKQHLVDIMNSEKLRYIRKKHLSEELDDIPACKHCGNRSIANISAFKEELMNLIC
jgi:radical SAM protein with 4Fe4S-binding SPASM domain